MSFRMANQQLLVWEIFRKALNVDIKDIGGSGRNRSLEAPFKSEAHSKPGTTGAFPSLA
ncbi:hypothetical protein [Oceanobacillus damuensis]|uniref:hypothetical protein n=1 Tax=Oceanobacillus damuensis TaxID=937928 RepID=UPI000B2F0555|nr:hypothetical protein [Oceanobacillus damuensis]